MRSFWMLGALVLVGCKTDVGLTESAICDGKKQAEEDTVDAPFDRDGDGFFDRSNPACQANYAVEDLDCNDAEEAVHPGAAEVECNGLDDDCDETTIDSLDEDEDGSLACDDCDDADALRRPENSETTCNGIDDDCDDTTLDDVDADGDNVSVCEDDCDDDEEEAYPGNDEVCEDNIDNDCNGETDEICDPADYTGTYTLDKTISYTCAFGSVKMNFTTFNVTHFDPNITFKPATGAQPPMMSGTVTGSSFLVSKTLSGTCDETYSVLGSFTSDTTFSATFTADYSGSACYDCTSQSWTITGTK
jgi:hypothetical protein